MKRTLAGLLVIVLCFNLITISEVNAVSNFSVDSVSGVSSTTASCSPLSIVFHFSGTGSTDGPNGYDEIAVVISDGDGSIIGIPKTYVPDGPFTLTTSPLGVGGPVFDSRPIVFSFYDTIPGSNSGVFLERVIWDPATQGLAHTQSLCSTLPLIDPPVIPASPFDPPPDTNPLSVSAACVNENLAVTITAGDGPFNITSSLGINTPVNGVNIGTTTINGPEKWDDLTVTETNGGLESINLGQFKCRTNERPALISPAHRTRTTNAFPVFSWTGISSANNYRIFVFDDTIVANRTVDIRQNSGGALSVTLNTALPNGRLFWRVRARQNRVWSLWSIRFTLFKDPVAPISVSTPIPAIELNPLSNSNNPASTFLSPPNSR